MQRLPQNNEFGPARRGKIPPMDFSDLDRGHNSAGASAEKADAGTEGKLGIDPATALIIGGIQDGVRGDFAKLADLYNVGSYEELDTATRSKFFSGALRVIKGLFDKIYTVYEKENQVFGDKTQEELFEAVYARIKSYVASMDAADLAKQSGLLDSGDDARFYVGRRLALLKDFIANKDYAFFRLRFRQFLDARNNEQK